MHDSITWIGMDVHKESIVVTAVGHDSEGIKARFETPNTDKGVHRLAKRIREFGEVRCAYEAGPCGYEIRRFLSSQGIPCEVVAPTLIPKKAGDRVKTDRRDAEKLARLHRRGELTAIRVPTPAQEALRDLVRTREDAKEDALRRRHRLQKFLLRQGRRYEGKSWTQAHWNWIRSLKFVDDNAQAVLAEYLLSLEQELERIKRLNEKIEEESRRPEIAPTVEKLRALRGVDTVTAMTLVSELVDMHRFATARELMAFAGLVPSEYSSGGWECRGRITKTGNAPRATCAGGGRLALPAHTGGHGDRPSKAARRTSRQRPGDRTTSGTSLVPEISEDDDEGEELPADGRICGQGTGRFRVGTGKIVVHKS
jgi:transposase